MTEPTDPINVGLLTPGPGIPRWAATAVEQMLRNESIEIALVVEKSASEDRSPGDAVRRVVELREWGPIAVALELLTDDLDAVEDIPVRDLEGVEDPEWMTCDPIPVDGWKTRLPSSAVERLAETDVAIRLGFGFLVGDALTAPEMGVLSFHHGNFREYRGQPMGFWEYVHGRETAGVTLQRVTETLDGGEIVTEQQVHVGDAPTWGSVKRRLFSASEGMLEEGIRTLGTNEPDLETLSEDDLGELYTLPRGWPVLTYVVRTTRGKLGANRRPSEAPNSPMSSEQDV